MGELKFGVIYSRLHPIMAPGDFGRRAESAGFDSVWVTEGLANQRAALDPVVAMMAIAEGTTHITVGSCVILLPLRTPAIFAKEIASLDLLSSGRIVLGVGVGTSSLSNPADFRACGIDPRHRGARCDEILDCMVALWRGEPTTYHGRFFDFEDIVLQPVPLQRPYPPLWMGGEARGVLKRTARIGDGFVPMGAGPLRYRELWDEVADLTTAAGRNADTITRAVHLFGCLDDDGDRALATVEHTLTERYGFAVKLPDRSPFLIGNMDECTRVIEDYQRAGVEHFVINIACPLDEVPDNMLRFAEELLPRFR